MSHLLRYNKEQENGVMFIRGRNGKIARNKDLGNIGRNFDPFTKSIP